MSDHELSQKQRVDTLADMGRHKELLASIAPLLASEPDNDVLLNQAAYAHLQLKDYDKALHYFQAAIRANPDNAHAFRLLSVLYHETGEAEQALELAEEAVRLAPENINCLCHLSSVQVNNKLYDAAEATVQQMLTIDPEGEPGRFQAGIIYLATKNYVAAEAQYRFLLTQNPNDSYIFNNLGIALYRQKKFEPALEFHTKALQADPQNEEAQRNLYDIILHHIGNGQWIGQGKKRFKSLPENIQAFFTNYRSQLHPVDRWTIPTTLAVIVGFLATIALVILLRLS